MQTTTFLWASALWLLAPAARAQDEAPPDAGVEKKAGTVLTFYGLRKLEQDPEVSDDEKMKEWQAFIERSAEQVEYAKKAVDRWKNAAKLRLVETAQRADGDGELPILEKIERWKQVYELYPRSKEGGAARKRAAHWTQEETKRRVEAAEEVERARKPKVERIQAWQKVIEWAKNGPETRAAEKRVALLQEQIFSEAESVDKIARIDKRTKLEAWADVLRGEPTPGQKKIAEQRVAELEKDLAPDG